MFTVAGVAGAVLFIVHQIPVKTALFLSAGLVEESTGATALDRVGGLLRRAPMIAGLFLLAALSLAGIPPLSGFVGKLAILEAGFSAEQYVVVGVSIVVSLFTLFSMVKIWNGVFWGTAEDPAVRLAAAGPRRPPAHAAADGRGDRRAGRHHPRDRAVRRTRCGT